MANTIVSLDTIVNTIPIILLGALGGAIVGTWGVYIAPTTIRKSFGFIEGEVDLIARQSKKLRFEGITFLFSAIAVGSNCFYNGLEDGVNSTSNDNYTFLVFNALSIAYEIYRRRN